MSRRSVPIEARITAACRVDTATPLINGKHCRVCTLYGGRGYPLVWYDGRLRKVSRVTWERTTGAKLTPDQHILHHCDNTRCVELKHLFLGDQQLNNADRDAKERQARGERVTVGKLVATQVLAIRADPRSCRAIAEDYGVASMTISTIKRRTTWKHLP